MVFVRETNFQILLEAGGEWDLIERRPTGRIPTRGRVIRVTEAQVDAVRYVAHWLALYRAGAPRDQLLMLGSKRRGGKTFILTLLLVALALEVPGAVCWLVSPARNRREELDALIHRWIPSTWWEYSGPEFLYTLANRSTIRNVSGAVPEALKRGGVFCYLLNEAQEMLPATLANAHPAIADVGGLGLLAANPPKRERGLWTKEVRKDLLAGKLAGQFVEVDPALNPHLDQDARTKSSAIVRSADPHAADTDAEGLWLPLGDVAYPAWTDDLVAPVPEVGLEDITTELCYREFAIRYVAIAGADFQRRPHQAAAVLRVFAGPRGPIYWFCDEIVVSGSERDLSDEALRHGYDRNTLIWIPDASGEWQDAERTGGTSYGELRSQLWHVEAPTEIQRPDRSRHPKNPPVDQRLGLLYRLMSERRLMVDPRCAWLIESFAKCPLGENRYGRRRPWGKHSHVTDGAGYPLWRLEPKAQEPVVPGVPMLGVPVARIGSDY
jgi:hypothetical protein